jgi:hypothetical protein
MKQNTTNVNTSELANYKVRCRRFASSEIDSLMPLLTGSRLRRLACLCLVGTMALAPDRYARADADDGPARILSFDNDSVATTVPGNGDVNPYGVAFVPPSFPQGGLLKPGDILVSNFNDMANVQGTGTTIVDVAQNNQTSLFFQGKAPLGLSTGLAVLKVGFVLVANCPTNGATPVPMALPGSLLLIDRFGKLSDTLGLSKEKWSARGLLLAVIALDLGKVYISVRINAWNNAFYNALQAFNSGELFRQLGTFCVLVPSAIEMSVYAL